MQAKMMMRALIIGIAALACSFAAQARHRHHAGDAAPGVFDYYLLSLSWSPAYCLQSPGSAECNGPRRLGFIVHGLWPQNERGWPENCAAAAGVGDDVVRSMLDIMPARGLVYHEWAAHGTCSGLSPAAYFALVRRAYESVRLPPAMVQGRAPVEEAPAAITAAFLEANRQLSPQSVVATCSGHEAPRLREVHVCFDRDLTPRACSADALHEACRAPTVIVPPVR